MPLYKLLKKSNAFVWMDEAHQALNNLKALLTSAPILVAPERREPLLLYLAMTTHVFSAALVVEREEPGRVLKVQ
jgi:dsDNA-binding SOS-regulon protein